MSYIKITNIRDGVNDCDFVYIKVNGSNLILGNPYILKNKSDNDERNMVIEQYRKLLQDSMSVQGEMYKEILRIKELLDSGKNVALSCWCSPLPCHAEVIAEAVQKLSSKQIYRQVKHLKPLKP